MRTFLGSYKTPHKKANTFLSHPMAAAADHRMDAGIVNTSVGSALETGAMVGEGVQETEEMRNEGSLVLWGEFQGTQQNEAEGASDWHTSGLHGCGPEESWVAFRDGENEKADGQETHISQHGGRWWCEDSTELCTREKSIDKSSVGNIFEQCFPSVLHPHVEDDVQPLELPLHEDCSHGHTQIWRRWGLSHHTRDPDHLYKLEGSHLCSAYLSSLHIDPTDKVASVSVHVTGFSPSHHLQSLFQHWTQPNGKTRLKVAYDFNRSLLV
ncbi:uncharacterized protein LOC134947842 isoform X2 [Pseudophryne corroboree]|uniref:uncharacterized protein LOC134947842 isoform X2 n=1 Tax=Pseudophryne corroboree TaxID=495146 RepID=UPI003081BE0D